MPQHGRHRRRIQILLDLDILGEKGKKSNYGLSDKESKRRHTRKPEDDSELLREREKAYYTSKIDLAKEMMKRAIKKGVAFRYVLAGSWFTCKEMVQFIHRWRNGCHWLGMIKVGEKGKTRYTTEHGDLTAPELVKLGKKLKLKKYSRKLRCHHR